MIVGVPAEVKDNEFRVAATPRACADLCTRAIASWSRRARATLAPRRRLRGRGADILPGHRRGVRGGRHDPQGEGAATTGVRAILAKDRSCSRTSTSLADEGLRGSYRSERSPPLPTRRCSSRTAACLSLRRCPRSRGGWLHTAVPQTSSGLKAAVAMLYRWRLRRRARARRGPGVQAWRDRPPHAKRGEAEVAIVDKNDGAAAVRRPDFRGGSEDA